MLNFHQGNSFLISFSAWIASSFLSGISVMSWRAIGHATTDTSRHQTRFEFIIAISRKTNHLQTNTFHKSLMRVFQTTNNSWRIIKNPYEALKTHFALLTPNPSIFQAITHTHTQNPQKDPQKRKKKEILMKFLHESIFLEIKIKSQM